jgi:Mn-dependent DtxR family transcriptional regulator
MAAYLQDLRDRLLQALERRDRTTAIADRFEVSRVSVYQVRNRLKQTGQRGSLSIGGHRQSSSVGMEPTLRAWVKETGDLTLAEMCARLRRTGMRSRCPRCGINSTTGSLRLKNPARQRARTRRRASRTVFAVKIEPHMNATKQFSEKMFGAL